jgi:hypothetical protein
MRIVYAGHWMAYRIRRVDNHYVKFLFCLFYKDGSVIHDDGGPVRMFRS